MKKQLLKMFGKRLTLAAIATFSLTVVIISSCTKKSDSTNYATQFVGTWNVTSNSCGGSGGTLVISAGSGNNALATSGTVGVTGCVKSITETGTASSNAFVFPSQTFTDGCGLSYTISIAGTLSGNTLTATTMASGAVSATCTITATK